MSELQKLEQEIVAEGEKARAFLEEQALKIRKENLLAEIAAIDAELEKFVEKVTKKAAPKK